MDRAGRIDADDERKLVEPERLLAIARFSGELLAKELEAGRLSS
jgi:hypothetical protein